MVDDVNCSLYADGVGTDLGVVPPLKVVSNAKVNHLNKYSRNRNYVTSIIINIRMMVVLSALISPANHSCQCLLEGPGATTCITRPWRHLIASNPLNLRRGWGATISFTHLL